MHAPRKRRGSCRMRHVGVGGGGSAWGGGARCGGGGLRTLESCDSLKLTFWKSPSASSAPEMSKPAADMPSILHCATQRTRAGEGAQWRGRQVVGSEWREQRPWPAAYLAQVVQRISRRVRLWRTCHALAFQGSSTAPAGLRTAAACLPHRRRRELATVLLVFVNWWELVLHLGRTQKCGCV